MGASIQNSDFHGCNRQGIKSSDDGFCKVNKKVTVRLKCTLGIC